jgi:hypothetical protein
MEYLYAFIAGTAPVAAAAIAVWCIVVAWEWLNG